MKKSSALLAVMILSFTISIYAGQALVNYVFEEEFIISTENDTIMNDYNTEDKELAKGTNDNQNDNL